MDSHLADRVCIIRYSASALVSMVILTRLPYILYSSWAVQLARGEIFHVSMVKSVEG